MTRRDRLAVTDPSAVTLAVGAAGTVSGRPRDAVTECTRLFRRAVTARHAVTVS
jgi:hypothetical protein